MSPPVTLNAIRIIIFKVTTCARSFYYTDNMVHTASTGRYTLYYINTVISIQYNITVRCTTRQSSAKQNIARIRDAQTSAAYISSNQTHNKPVVNQPAGVLRRLRSLSSLCIRCKIRLYVPLYTLTKQVPEKQNKIKYLVHVLYNIQNR